MTEIEFEALAAQGYNRIPVRSKLFCRSRYAPVDLYLKLAGEPFLPAGIGARGERFGRYSIIGLATTTRIVVRADEVLVLTGNRIAERDQGESAVFHRALHGTLQGAGGQGAAAFSRWGQPGRPGISC